MAIYLLKRHAPQVDGHDLYEQGNAIDAAPSNNPLVRFQRGFEQRFIRMRASYRDALTLAIEHRRLFVGGFLLFVTASFLLLPFVGRNFFPFVDGGQILMHVRAPVGLRVEETAARFADVQKAVRDIIPANELGAMVDNVGTYISSINTIYNNTGTIAEQDRDIHISLNERHAPTAD
jgi:multidrug efflux pump subunit AcrB